VLFIVEMASESDVGRLFLQAVFSRGLLSAKLAQTLWFKCVEAVKGGKGQPTISLWSISHSTITFECL